MWGLHAKVWPNLILVPVRVLKHLLCLDTISKFILFKKWVIDLSVIELKHFWKCFRHDAYLIKCKTIASPFSAAIKNAWSSISTPPYVFFWYLATLLCLITWLLELHDHINFNRWLELSKIDLYLQPICIKSSKEYKTAK